MLALIIQLYLIYSVAVYGSDYYDEITESTSSTETGDNEPRFEGDMLGFNNIQEMLDGNPEDPEVQDMALSDESSKWKDATIGYQISKDFPCKEKCIILEAMHEMEMKTCLKFVENNGRDDYVDIRRQGFCASHVGRQGNRQKLYLSSSCASKVGVVIHELMHAIGFFHEQSRKDRNDYVTVFLHNVAEIDEHNFRNHGFGNVTLHGLPYDYDSLMHYGEHEFSMNRRPTIKGKNNRKIGQREKMSDLDIRKINIHYKCTNAEIGCVDTWSKCRDSFDMEASCRDDKFRSKCKKSCRVCLNESNIQRNSTNVDCQTPTQRCAKFAGSSGDCSKKNNLASIRSHCYRSCNFCQLNVE